MNLEAKLLEPKSMNNNDLVGFTKTHAICGRMEPVNDDKLSSLPDDLIHKILSFASIKDAIRTSELSYRWRYIWPSMPYLNFEDFTVTSNYFDEVLSRLKNSSQVSSVKLVGGVNHELIEKIVEYIVSHKVPQLTIECNLGTDANGFPLSSFTSKSLKHLTLVAYEASFVKASPTWELPVLTTLHLAAVTLSDEHLTEKCIDLFAKCTNLKNLFLRNCKVKGAKDFNIYHPQLANLTIEHILSDVEVFNVVTPQLKNLTITYCYGMHQISAPELTSLVMKAEDYLEISTQGFPSLEKVDLFLKSPRLVDATQLVCLLQRLHNAKFLKLNLEILKVLWSSTELISLQASTYLNWTIIKFLLIDSPMVHLKLPTQEKVTMSTEIKNLESSPSAIFTMVSPEEIQIMENMVPAQKLIEELKVLVNKCKANSDQTTSRKRKRREVQVRKQWVQSAIEMQWLFGEMMEQIELGKSEGILLTNELPTLETRNMISSLESIEKLVTELPESKRAAMKATFSSMCEEASNLMSDMMDGMDKPVILRSSRARKTKVNYDPSFIYWCC